MKWCERSGTAGVALIAAVCLAGLPGSATAQFNDGFGSAVSVSDGVVVVLKPRVGAGRAGAYLFGREAGGWMQAGARHPIAGDQTGEGFGSSMAVGEGIIAVAAGDPDGLWGAHLFGAGGGVRLPLVEDAASRGPAPVTLAMLGRISTPQRRTIGVSEDGSVVAVADDGPAGSTLRVFEREGGEAWSETARIELNEGRPTGSLVVGRDRVFVGIPGGPVGGAVVLIERSDEGWAETATLGLESDAEDGNDWGGLGSALALVPRGVVVGVPGAGLVVALTEDGDGWLPSEPIRAPEGASEFGAALALSDAELWVGAPGTEEGRGAVFRYAWNGAAVGDLLGRIAREDAAPGDRLGFSVAVSDGIGVAGAPRARAGRGGALALVRSAGADWSAAEWLEAGPPLEAVTGAEVGCSQGRAGPFDCEGVDLLAFVPLAALGADVTESVSDVWGWTDPETGREYALVGRSTGAAIVDVSEPSTPVFIGTVPGNRTSARDIKVYGQHMFFTGDSAGDHGLLVFDLTRLRDVTAVPVEFTPDARYDEIASAHNLVIDTETGFGFTVGNRAGGTTCGGGLHMVDLRDPLAPVFAGCYTDTEGLIWQGRTHDAQCVVYHGPDADYQGREICFALNETAVRIVDVTDKSNPIPISTGTYPGIAYVHQGWLTEDHRYFYQNDELDELAGTVSSTRTLVWNVEDLDDPVVASEHFGASNATDHNLYVVGNRMYQANYHAGLRVFDISDRESPVEIGFFDTTPYGGDPPGYTGGAWTAFPFFASGTVVVSSMNEGLFVLRPRRPILP